MKKLILILAIAFATAIQAAPVTITRTKMSELFIALKGIGPGLTPQNTGIAADDINAMEKLVDARDKAITQAQRDALSIDRQDPEFGAKQKKIQDSFDAFSETETKIELTPLTISDNEIRDARIAPGTLAIIRKYLSASAPAK